MTAAVDSRADLRLRYSPDAMTAAEILEAAAELVERPGVWGQGLPAIAAGRACVGVALQTCGRADEASAHAAWDALCLAIGLPRGDIQGMVHWNDAPERTAACVALALRTAKNFL